MRITVSTQTLTLRAELGNCVVWVRVAAAIGKVTPREVIELLHEVVGVGDLQKAKGLKMRDSVAHPISTFAELSTLWDRYDSRVRGVVKLLDRQFLGASGSVSNFEECSEGRRAFDLFYAELPSPIPVGYALGFAPGFVLLQNCSRNVGEMTRSCVGGED